MCTVCNYTHKFVSAHTLAFVCSSCNSILHRGVTYTDNKPLQAFRVEEDMSVFRIGSEIKHQSVNYTFIGRFQFFLNSCVRNKWILKGEKDEIAFMIEQAGFYAIVFKHHVNLSRSELSLLQPGAEFYINDTDRSVFLESMFSNTSTRTQGEVFDIEQDQLPFIAADYLNAEGKYVFLQMYDKKNNTLFKGDYITYNKLKVSNVRIADEWK